MQHIDLKSQNAQVRQFFLSLNLEAEGSLVEIDGQAVARLLPIQDSASQSDVAAIQAGVIAAEEGRVSLLEEVDARIRQKLGYAKEA